ncbi:MAG: hypothetical protein U0Z17_00045 [Bacteroidales bacterium]
MLNDFSHHDIEKLPALWAKPAVWPLSLTAADFCAFSLGDYLDGTEAGYKALNTELECAIRAVRLNIETVL